ncbi:unnamed protein product [Pedinophyceae sp. YPF-701]|nr:unnamed protein product [Pedinophyceae sp. YPF-701]
MKLRAHLLERGRPMSDITASVDVYCGSGEQIIRWIGVTACCRLAEAKGELVQAFVPQSVLDSHHNVLDVEVIVNEVLEDGDEVFVEYSSGPRQFTVKWEGRPVSPRFTWGEGAPVDGGIDAWLEALDISRLPNLDQAVGIQNQALTEDIQPLRMQIKLAHDVLKKYAGILQLVFVFYTSSGESNEKAIHCDFINPTNFRGFCKGAKLISDAFNPQQADSVFQQVLGCSPRAQEARGRGPPSECDLADFLLLIVLLAADKFSREEGFLQAAPLQMKVEQLIKHNVIDFVVPKIQESLAGFRAALTPAVEALLDRASDLLRATLDSVVFKRTKKSRLTGSQVDVKYLVQHMQRWGVMQQIPQSVLPACWAFAATREVDDVAADPTKVTLKHTPVALTHSEFPRFMFATIREMYSAARTEEPIEKYLAAQFDNIFRASGAMAQRAGLGGADEGPDDGPQDG